MGGKRLLIPVLVLILLLSLIPYHTYESDTGVRIYQAFLYALAQKQTEQGEYAFSHLYWFPESLNSDENLHKKELESWKIS